MRSPEFGGSGLDHPSLGSGWQAANSRKSRQPPRPVITDFCNKIGTNATRQRGAVMSALRWIVLQKSKVAGLRIFRENTKREAIADSYNLIRVTEVAYEFNTRR